MSNTQDKPRYILTGTPGSGKTTLLRALEIEGYTVIEEAATDVIALSQALGEKTPWEKPGFVDQVLDLQLQRQRQASQLNDSVQCYDRSPICTYALALFLKREPSKQLSQAIDAMVSSQFYEPKVFFVDQLSFTAPTHARTISHEQAVRFEQMHLEAYQQFGYQCIHIKPDTIEMRLQHIIENMRPI